MLQTENARIYTVLLFLYDQDCKQGKQQQIIGAM